MRVFVLKSRKHHIHDRLEARTRDSPPDLRFLEPEEIDEHGGGNDVDADRKCQADVDDDLWARSSIHSNTLTETLMALLTLIGTLLTKTRMSSYTNLGIPSSVSAGTGHVRRTHVNVAVATATDEIVRIR